MKITSFTLPSLVLAAMVVTCAADPAWAEQVPRGVQADERIKTVIYRPDDVIGLVRELRHLDDGAVRRV